jgi:hypothetical protein
MGEARPMNGTAGDAAQPAIGATGDRPRPAMRNSRLDKRPPRR